MALALEIPSGAWADAFSRRWLLVAAGVGRGVAFTSWLLWPSYPAFALGFALWGVSSAMRSGTVEALLYDELAAVGAAGRYPEILGRGETAALLALLAATGLATPAMIVGGYPLAGAASVLVSLAFSACSLSMPERPRARPARSGAGGPGHYLRTLRSGLAEVRGEPLVGRAVAIAAAVPALAALDEYLPVLARAMGTPAVSVPVVLLVPAVAMALGSAVAGRWAGVGPGRMAATFAVAALLLAGGASASHPSGMLAVAGYFGVMQFGMVITDARLQAVISGPARATILSVAGFGAEVGSLVLYAGFAAGSRWLPVPVLVGLAAVPVVALALVTRRWLPPRRPARQRAGDRR